MRFKKSAAHSSYTDTSVQGISHAGTGLIQIIADNFDADISPRNGKLSTHALAMIVIQPSAARSPENTEEEQIRRKKKEDMSPKLPEYDGLLNMSYQCTQKPAMIEVASTNASHKMDRFQQVSHSRAEENDLQFLRDAISLGNFPEYNGFNTKQCREQGHSTKPKTKVAYLPLMNNSPSDPKTMMSSIMKAKRITAAVGQEYVGHEIILTFVTMCSSD